VNTPDKIAGNTHRIIFTLIIVLIVTVIVGIIVLAAVPPVSRDALTHHLAVPKLYLAHGGIVEITDAIASYYPMNIDLLYMIPLLIGNDIAAKYIHFGFALLTAALIFAYLADRIGRVYGAIGVLLFLSLPVIVRLSITVYVDLALIFFSFASILALLKWKTSGFRIRYLVLSSCLCGLAMGTKYNGIVVCILLVLATGFIYSRGIFDEKRSMKPMDGLPKACFYALLFATVAILIFSPWAIRNWWWTNNPFYPLYDTLFNPNNPYIETTLRPFLIRKLVYHEDWLDILLVPFRIFYSGQDNVPALFDGRLNPYLLILPPFGALLWSSSENRRLRIEIQLFAYFAILFIAIVYFTRDMRIRYLAPAIPPLVIVAICGVHQIIASAKTIDNRILRKFAYGLCGVGIAIFLVPNGEYIVEQFHIVQPVAYLSGEINRDQYIEMYRPEYPAIKYINQRLSENAIIYCLFIGNRRYYFDRTTIFDDKKIQTIIKTSTTEDDIAQALDQMGVTHLLIGLDFLPEWIHRNYTPEEKKRIVGFFNHKLENVFSKNNYSLYHIKISQFN